MKGSEEQENIYREGGNSNDNERSDCRYAYKNP